MKKYVVGFLFNNDMTKIVLIHKNRPEWQVGKLNGIGGKIEENESSYNAMIREFKEETSLLINNWKSFCQLSDINKKHEIIFYYALSDNISDVKTITDEKVEIFNIDDLYKLSVIDNLKWIIPLCIDKNNINCSVITK